MGTNFHPVYDFAADVSSDRFLTVDGRLGLILQFETESKLRIAFRQVKKKYPMLHLQAQDFFGRYLLSVSKYIYRPAPGITSLIVSHEKGILRSAILEADTLLNDIQTHFKASVLTEYPELPESFEQHLFKMKYSVDWENNERTFQPRQGFCLIHVPPYRKVRVLYYTTDTLADLLSERILCLEFTEDFLRKAFRFWIPLGAFHYLATLFKL